MAISQIGGIVYTNQNMQVAATKQLDFQNRVDLQNYAAVEAANDKQKQIDETRPTEDSKGINAEREHQREQKDKESGEKEEEIKIKFEEEKEKEEESKITSNRILDIRA